MRRRVTQRLQTGPGATVAEIRDLLGTTRKFAVPLCEYLDRVGLTRREGDLRVLAEPTPQEASARISPPYEGGAGVGRQFPWAYFNHQINMDQNLLRTLPSVHDILETPLGQQLADSATIMICSWTPFAMKLPSARTR